MRSGPVRRGFALLMLLGMILAGYGTCNAYDRHFAENDCLQCVSAESVHSHGGEGEAPSVPHHCPNHPCSGHLSISPGPCSTLNLPLPVAVVPSISMPAPLLHSVAPPDQPPRA